MCGHVQKNEKLLKKKKRKDHYLYKRKEWLRFYSYAQICSISFVCPACHRYLVASGISDCIVSKF